MNNENINDIMTKLFEFNNELENTDLTSDSTVSNLSVNDLISLLKSKAGESLSINKDDVLRMVDEFFTSNENYESKKVKGLGLLNKAVGLFDYFKDESDKMSNDIKESYKKLKEEINNYNLEDRFEDVLKSSLMAISYRNIISENTKISSKIVSLKETISSLEPYTDLDLKTIEHLLIDCKKHLSEIAVDIQRIYSTFPKKDDIVKKDDSEEKIISEKIEEARNALNHVLDSLDRDEFNSVKEMINNLPESDAKNEMVAELSKVEEYININDALIHASSTLNADDLRAAVDLINALPDSVRKTDFLNEAIDIQNRIDHKADFELASNKLEEARNVLDLSVWKSASDMINALPDSDDKNALLSEYEDLLADNKQKLIDFLDNITTDYYDSLSLDAVKNRYENAEEMIIRFKLLKEDEKTDEIRDKIKNVIAYNNSDYQTIKKIDEANRLVDKKTMKKSKIKILTIITEAIGSVFTSAYYGGKRGLNRILKKLRPAWHNNDTKKIKKYEPKYYDRDIVSGPVLYTSLNKLQSLKPRLYKNGINNFTNSEERYYKKTTSRIKNKYIKSLDKKLASEEQEILSDKKRSINILNQYMQMLSLMYCEKEESEKNFEKVRNFLTKLYNKGVIEEDEFLAYYDEIDNIKFHKTDSNNSQQYIFEDSMIDTLKQNVDKDDKLPYLKKIA